MIRYKYNPVTGEYLGIHTCQKTETGYIWPKHTVDIKSPDTNENQVAIWVEGTGWTVKPDFRGSDTYSDKGVLTKVHRIGETPRPFPQDSEFLKPEWNDESGRWTETASVGELLEVARQQAENRIHQGFLAEAASGRCDTGLGFFVDARSYQDSYNFRTVATQADKGYRCSMDMLETIVDADNVERLGPYTIEIFLDIADLIDRTVLTRLKKYHDKKRLIGLPNTVESYKAIVWED